MLRMWLMSNLKCSQRPMFSYCTGSEGPTVYYLHCPSKISLLLKCPIPNRIAQTGMQKCSCPSEPSPCFHWELSFPVPWRWDDVWLPPPWGRTGRTGRKSPASCWIWADRTSDPKGSKRHEGCKSSMCRNRLWLRRLDLSDWISTIQELTPQKEQNNTKQTLVLKVDFMSAP